MTPLGAEFMRVAVACLRMPFVKLDISTCYHRIHTAPTHWLAALSNPNSMLGCTQESHLTTCGGIGL